MPTLTSLASGAANTSQIDSVIRNFTASDTVATSPGFDINTTNNRIDIRLDIAPVDGTSFVSLFGVGYLVLDLLAFSAGLNTGFTTYSPGVVFHGMSGVVPTAVYARGWGVALLDTNGSYLDVVQPRASVMTSASQAPLFLQITGTVPATEMATAYVDLRTFFGYGSAAGLVQFKAIANNLTATISNLFYAIATQIPGIQFARGGFGFARPINNGIELYRQTPFTFPGYVSYRSAVGQNSGAGQPSGYVGGGGISQFSNGLSCTVTWNVVTGLLLPFTGFSTTANNGAPRGPAFRVNVSDDFRVQLYLYAGRTKGRQYQLSSRLVPATVAGEGTFTISGLPSAVFGASSVTTGSVILTGVPATDAPVIQNAFAQVLPRCSVLADVRTETINSITISPGVSNSADSILVVEVLSLTPTVTLTIPVPGGSNHYQVSALIAAALSGTVSSQTTTYTQAILSNTFIVNHTSFNFSWNNSPASGLIPTVASFVLSSVTHVELIITVNDPTMGLTWNSAYYSSPSINCSLNGYISNSLTSAKLAGALPFSLDPAANEQYYKKVTLIGNEIFMAVRSESDSYVYTNAGGISFVNSSTLPVSSAWTVVQATSGEGQGIVYICNSTTSYRTYDNTNFSALSGSFGAVVVSPIDYGTVNQGGVLVLGASNGVFVPLARYVSRATYYGGSAISSSVNFSSACYGINANNSSAYTTCVLLSTGTSNTCTYLDNPLELIFATRTLPASATWVDVSFGFTESPITGVFLGLATNSTNAFTLTSSTAAGVTDSQTLPASLQWVGSIFCQNINAFLVIASNSSTYYTTPTGVTGTYTAGTITVSGTPMALDWKKPVYGRGKVMLVAKNSDIYVYSTDGLQTWQQGTFPASGDWLLSFGIF